MLELKLELLPMFSFSIIQKGGKNNNKLINSYQSVYTEQLINPDNNITLTKKKVIIIKKDV
jgi:hypothetical protein|tara:strand:- start:205 stop:387 length:183 start_codon:yes stop_codon:yes gene_type:complete